MYTCRLSLSSVNLDWDGLLTHGNQRENSMSKVSVLSRAEPRHKAMKGFWELGLRLLENLLAARTQGH